MLVLHRMDKLRSPRENSRLAPIALNRRLCIWARNQIR